MTLPSQIKVKHISHVLDTHSKVNQAIDALNSLIWDTLQGEDSWYKLGDNPYAFYVTYWVWNKTLEIKSVHGTFKEQKYKISFIGRNYFELVLPIRKYVFSGNPVYGSFSTDRDFGLITGSAYYQNLATYDTKWAESDEDFSRNTKWLMNSEKELEAATFVLELCKTIRQRKIEDD